EMKGTYPLPEAQKDRFMFKIDMRAGSAADLAEVLRRTTGTDAEEPQSSRKNLSPWRPRYAKWPYPNICVSWPPGP
ncbi:hypothetical protein ACFL4W_05445, partial [Planctomycetota bacterium]